MFECGDAQVDVLDVRSDSGVRTQLVCGFQLAARACELVDCRTRLLIRCKHLLLGQFAGNQTRSIAR